MTELKTITAEEIQSMEQRYRAQLINSLGGFKSLNLIGTKSTEGIRNLAIVNSVVHLGANPALMGYIQRPTTVQRDTYENIKSTGVYTFNHVREEFVQEAHHTAARWEQDEFEACGLTPVDDLFDAPFVKESNIRIGLRFEEEHAISNGTIMVVGAIEMIQVPESLIENDGFIDIQSAGSLTVSGLDAYHTADKLVRLEYAKPDQKPGKLSV